MTERKADGHEIANTIRAMIGKDRAYFMMYFDDGGRTHIVTNIEPQDQVRFLEITAEGIRISGTIAEKLAKPS